MEFLAGAPGLQDPSYPDLTQFSPGPKLQASDWEATREAWLAVRPELRVPFPWGWNSDPTPRLPTATCLD